MSNKIVNDRRSKREAPAPHFSKVAQVWSVLLGVNVDAAQVVQCMVALKLVREAGHHDPDNMADVEGYASLYQEVVDGNNIQMPGPVIPPGTI